MATTFTDVAICNTALTCLGADTINSLDEPTINATLCKQLYQQVRTQLLFNHPWNFAIKRQALAQLDAPAEQKDYKYAYKLPANCIRLLKVEQDISYRLEGRDILTNTPECFIKYIDDVQDSSLYSQGFVQDLIAKIRSLLVYPITKSTSAQQYWEQIYIREHSKNTALDESETIQDDFGQQSNGLLSARFGSTYTEVW